MKLHEIFNIEMEKALFISNNRIENMKDVNNLKINQIIYEKNINNLDKYKDEKFDLIICHFKIGSSKNIKKTIQQMIDLSNDGYIYIEYFYSLNNPILDNYRKILREINWYKFTQFEILECLYYPLFSKTSKVGCRMLLKLYKNEIKINNAWEGKSCFILGSGPSLNNINLKKLKNYNTICSNMVLEDFEPTWYLRNHFDQKYLLKKELSKYNGIVFFRNIDVIERDIKNLIKYNITKKVEKRIEDGLLFDRLTGLTMMNLALISGAYPIYLIGFDCGKHEHYKEDYQGREVSMKNMSNYYLNSINLIHKLFLPYKDKFINLSENSKITIFKKKKIEDIWKITI